MSASFRFVTASLALLIASLALGSRDANAICLPIPYYRSVGDTASDPNCTDNDIQSAIDNAVCPTTIVITREHLYTAQHLTIANKSLALVATGDGFACPPPGVICDPDVSNCNAPPPTTPQVAINGAGHTGDSVLAISGNSYVTLRYLEIAGGIVGSDQSGGGIYFGGAGSLTLDTSTVDNNHAGYGGGINMAGSGDGATLTLLENSLVLNNTAVTSGGGIRMEGNSRLFALEDKTLIAFNDAPGGYGGGVEVIGPARADIGSPGYNGLGVIYDNTAAYGGGLSANAINNGEDATLRLFTVDPANPVRIQSNTASHTGGGVYLKPLFGGIVNVDLAAATLCAFDFRMDDNIAQEGSAIYADEDYSNFAADYYGSNVYLNTDPYTECSMPESPPSLGAVACAPDVVCNSVDGNTAEDGASQPTDGSAILVQTYGNIVADRLALRGNRGGHAIRTFSPDPYTGSADLYNCLLADNLVSGELIDVQGAAESGYDPRPTRFVNCTFAHNAIGGSTVIHAADSFTMVDSIIDEPGIPTLAYSGNPANLAVQYLLSNDTSTLPVATGVMQGEPTFVDAANGDYHLQLSSLGIDIAPARSGSDLDRHPRTVDLPAVPNDYGPLDLGAYERQFACAGPDTLFCDGFETQ